MMRIRKLSNLSILQVLLILAVASLVTNVFSQAKTIIEIDTTKGVIQLELYPEKAPKTVENFLHYVETGYFEQLVFHRVIDNWIIQSGGYDENFMMEDTLLPIRNEATNGLKNKRGTIAMARMIDPHSADTQFFINLSDNNNLDHRARTFNDYGYCVFGKVIEGMDVSDAIGDVETHEIDGYQDVPIQPVFLKSARIISRDLIK